MKEDSNVVLVSNRGPVSFVKNNGDFDIKRGAGGLAGAMDPVARRLGDRSIWIAAATSEDDRRALAAGAADGLSERLGYSVYLIDIDPDTYRSYYDVVSNRMLWFANHCLWDELDIDPFGDEELDAWRKAYEPVNRRFSGAVLEIAGPQDLVLVQDYHLATTPLHLRNARPEQAVLHFTHSCFCGPAGLEPLPDEIAHGVIEGMLGADLVGFHVAAWVSNFLDCCDSFGYPVDRAAGVVESGGRTVHVREYPIPIDVKELRQRAAGDAAGRWREELSRPDEGPLIVRADRSEPSKNIVRGFEAFGVLLDRRSDLVGRAHFVACLYPSRQSMEEYQIYGDQVQAAVDSVNERHNDSIRLFMKDDYDRTLGALATYDVLLVNPLMDGMNLVSKEGAAINQQQGVLVLSSGAGSFEELGSEAVQIADPRNVEATAVALEIAIDMHPEERARRAAALRSLVEERTPEDWIQSQIDDLARVQSGDPPATPPSRV